jgi:hypothetical protein
MLPIRINNQPLLLRRLEPGDIGLLCEYLADLGEATRKRFGPHLLTGKAGRNLREQG